MPDYRLLRLCAVVADGLRLSWQAAPLVAEKRLNALLD